MRKNEDRIEQKKISYYKKVIDGYLQKAKNNKERFVVIDGSNPKDEISHEIINSLKKVKKKNKVL